MVIDLEKDKRVGIRKAAGNGNRDKTPWYAWLRWGDYVMYALIGSLALVLLVLAPGAGMGAAADGGAVLVQDDQVVQQWSADELASQGEKIFTSNNYHYTVTWGDGQIRFSAADCPDKVCVRTGWISHWGEIAACVPGHLILKVRGGDSGTTVDTSGVDVIVK